MSGEPPLAFASQCSFAAKVGVFWGHELIEVMTVFDREKIFAIQKLVSELIQIYRNEYAVLKSQVSSDCEERFWCKGWREAYAPDYMNEISDNTQEARKILPKEPRKKAYTSLHCYSEKKPVISMFYGNDGNVCMEKFFVEMDDRIVGICYTTNDGNIYSLSVETRNADGFPCKYAVCYMDMNNRLCERPQYLLRFAEYHYDEQDHIISASYADRVKIPSGEAPEYLEDYAFLYENGVVTHFTRTNYSADFEKKTENTWKFDRWILKRYQDDGIRYFG